MTTDTVADWLRALPSLTGTALPLEAVASGADPVAIFLEWIQDASVRGVPEPHAVTLATVDADGMPDARTLVLKDVGARGWGFAGHRDSRKSAQVTARPVAALNFWWQPVLRAIRVRGTVVEASAQESAADLAARSEAAREGIATGDWVLWRIIPTRIEFWQGAVDRNHTRVVFERVGDRWLREPQYLHGENERKGHA